VPGSVTDGWGRAAVVKASVQAANVWSGGEGTPGQRWHRCRTEQRYGPGNVRLLLPPVDFGLILSIDSARRSTTDHLLRRALKDHPERT
jgi:hypothetical protein